MTRNVNASFLGHPLHCSSHLGGTLGQEYYTLLHPIHRRRGGVLRRVYLGPPGGPPAVNLGLAFYGRRAYNVDPIFLTLSSRLDLFSTIPGKGLTCPIQNRYSRCNRARVYALSWESLPHRRIQYLPSPGLPHQCLCRPPRSQPYHRHDSSRYYDLQNQLRTSINGRRRSLLFWISPLVWPSSCSILKARLAPGAIEPASNFLARSAGPDNCRRIRPRKYE